MDVFRTPGNGLTAPSDIRNFEEIKAVLDRCTNDILIRSDWEANLQLVDLVNSTKRIAVRTEVVFLLRRKLSSSRARTVSLTISLVEALVKNGDSHVHEAIGSESFMKEMAKVARKYSGKGGSDNIEVAELSLDVIQAWGEAFLSRQRQFPAFVKTYHDLRKEGLQFKPQYDINRVPIFTPVACDPSDGSGGREDSGILKAAMAASMDSSPTDNNFVGRSTKGASASADLLESMVTSVSILCEMLAASSSASALRSNDIAGEVALQLRSLQNGLGAAIEYELTRDPEGTELLFKMNDDSQMLLAVYDGVMDGTCTLAQAMEIVAILGGGAPTAAPLPESAPSSSSASNGSDLLDFLDSGTPLNLDVWSVPHLNVADSKAASFSFAPPHPAASTPALFDPFDTDPFGPGTSSIDDLLASPATVVSSPVPDLFGDMSSSQQAFPGQPPSQYSHIEALMSATGGAPLEMGSLPAAKSRTVDLNALIFSGNNNASMYQGQGINQQLQQPQYQQQQFGGSPWGGPASPISTPDAYQYPYAVPQVPYQQQQQQQQQQPQYSTSPTGSAFLSPHMYGPPPLPMMPPPLPTSPPPAAPQHQANPFDSF